MVLNIYIRQLEVRQVTSLTRIVFFFVWFETGPLLLFVCWWVRSFFFFVAPFSLLAVFSNAENFNQDVSKWNTGAVTTMYRSKCTLSLLSISVLWPRRFPLWCVVEDIYDSSRFVGSHVSHVLFLFLVVV